MPPVFAYDPQTKKYVRLPYLPWKQFEDGSWGFSFNDLSHTEIKTASKIFTMFSEYPSCFYYDTKTDRWVWVDRRKRLRRKWGKLVLFGFLAVLHTGLGALTVATVLWADGIIGRFILGGILGLNAMGAGVAVARFIELAKKRY